ncbi:MAG: adenylate/guanylate cyclase domain-containing response regulator [Burkholderiales bacterium]|nr:adenylate/guanylate cyclase domain-containing response regulator [Burkholderiales bacterium]
MKKQSARILVVEDDAFFRGLLVRQLRREGYHNVAVAKDGHNALALIRAGDVDLVLLDIELPELDGMGVLKRLRTEMPGGDVPIIVISGVDDIASVASCIELGAEDYLPKPFEPAILRARIGASLEKRRLRRLETTRLAQIRGEQEKTEALLHVLLPAAAARELKDRGTVASRRHEEVAVLFCDIVGFTAYCERHEPEGVVSRLQRLVERFESITERHGLEKIKTIGDAYMATAGMPRTIKTPITSAVRCGLDMIAAAAEVAPDWPVRVGVDCGPLVSGVLGRQKFQFDVWGRTVNLAARLTEFARPGTIAMTRDAWQRLDDGFAGRPIGRTNVKGIGLLQIVECSGVALEQGALASTGSKSAERQKAGATPRSHEAA